jgi:hypothetical protein
MEIGTIGAGDFAQAFAKRALLAPNNVALKSILIGSWFRLPDEEKQKDFER